MKEFQRKEKCIRVYLSCSLLFMNLTRVSVLAPELQAPSQVWLEEEVDTQHHSIIRPPVRSNGRPYKMLVMFFFFSPPNLRAPSADRLETLSHDRNRRQFYKLTPKIRGALPPKKLRAKNMQNFGRFYTTSDFDREYLRNGSRYPKLES